MAVFNNGCVCCTIDDYRFAIAVQQITQETRPELGRQFPTQGVFIGKDVHAYRDEIIRRFRACERADAEKA
jgi:phosphoglucomutase